jgi:hypothetical protein
LERVAVSLMCACSPSEELAKPATEGENSLDGFYGSVKDVVMDGLMDGKAQMLDMGWMKMAENG